MKLVCSFCHVALGEKEPLDDPTVTHGMCPACFHHFEQQWQGQRLGEYLDAFDVPVVVVNREGRVVAANQHMAAMLGKEDRETNGLLGGEVMECVYSRLEGGCGRTVHCAACTVRRAVTTTLETGAALERVPAFIDRDDHRLHLSISAYKEGETVRLEIHDTRLLPKSVP